MAPGILCALINLKPKPEPGKQAFSWTLIRSVPWILDPISMADPGSQTRTVILSWDSWETPLVKDLGVVTHDPDGQHTEQ